MTVVRRRGRRRAGRSTDAILVPAILVPEPHAWLGRQPDHDGGPGAIATPARRT